MHKRFKESSNFGLTTHEAANGEAVALVAAVLRVQARGVEVQIPSARGGEGGRRPVVAARAAIAEGAIGGVVVA